MLPGAGPGSPLSLLVRSMRAQLTSEIELWLTFRRLSPCCLAVFDIPERSKEKYT